MNTHGGNLWVGGEISRGFLADGHFLCADSEVDELGVNSLKRSEKEQSIHCGTPERESQLWKMTESLGCVEGPVEVVNHALIMIIVV